MRGAHRDVWCSKIQHLIEAELFAAQVKRPALPGRALLCAAVYAREIQGLTASHNLPDARNRAPVTPFRCTSPMCQRKGGFGGVKRGKGNHTVPLPPFVPAGEHRLSRPPKAATVHAHFERKAASSGTPLYRQKVCLLLTIRFLRICKAFYKGFSRKALHSTRRYDIIKLLGEAKPLPAEFL